DENGKLGLVTLHGWQILYSRNGTTTLNPHDQKIPGYHLSMTIKVIGYQTLQQLGQLQQVKQTTPR
ncbi:MAG: hypothetical protein V3V22_06860, partial [Methylococcales bacterium]